ncbi:MAG: GNAT family N-acetyltransferase [Tannerellaceae bacterium]
MNGNITIVQKSDLPAILELQYEAFGRVAQAISNPNLPSLKQTLEELQEEYAEITLLKYMLNDRIVGSIRARLDDENICHIGALIVASGNQNMGIGSALVQAIEKQFSHCSKYALFTSLHTPNTNYLYTKLGYSEVSRGEINGTPMIFMEKQNNEQSN